ncbi:MAG: hypothetical protein ACXW2T_06700 [Allosphingosinicella sp.]
MSTIAVDKGHFELHIAFRDRIPGRKEIDMRIIEMAFAGIIAVAAQMLVVGAVLI